MATARALVLAASLAAVSAEAAGFHYGFSDCVDNKRTLFYYTDEGGTCSQATDGQELAKPPVRGLRCDVTCDRGYFLGANFTGETPVSGCERCPKGKYSLGGGKLFSQRTGAWSTPLPIDIHTDCVTQDMYSGQWVNNCQPWSASADGSFVSSGDNSGVLENYEATRLFSTLRVSATLVRDGSITYQYRVDAEDPYDGLIFQIDDNAATPLVSQSDGWKEVVHDVPAGAHTFSWDYMKDYAGDKGEDKAFIKVIEIVGTSFSDLHCHTCGGDMTMTGGSICAFCDANQYSAAKSDSELDFTCYPCPTNTYAPKGSIGIESCVERRVCTDDDLVATYSACVNGKRDVTYAWSEPQTCETSLSGSISLPAAQTGVDCTNCAPGYQLMDDNTCEVCPAGQKSSNDGCEACPKGQVVVNELAFGDGTLDGWSAWPSIVDSDAAKTAGWKLTQNGLTFVAHAASKGNHHTRFPVAFNVSFLHSGYFNLTYELANVPTFADEGARAWLELEVKDVGDKSASKSGKLPLESFKGLSSSTVGDKSGDDDDDEEDVDASVVHLIHGGENGTFSELVHFNVTSETTKQFKVVLRSTSPAATQFIQAKIRHLGFVGTAQGGGVDCGGCPAGYEAIGTSDDTDDDEDTIATGCRICPSGTYAKSNKGMVTCTACPADTYSSVGASECIACGANTYSSGGAKSCAAPKSLTLNASTTDVSTSSSASTAATVSTASGLQLTYNISLLESLAWGNESWIFEDTVYGNTSGYLTTDPVYGTEAFEMDKQNFIFAGLFRPVAADWQDVISGQIVEQDIDMVEDRPYIVLVSMLNARDAGNYFFQNSARYGEVMCSAPSQWKISSGGSHMEIQPLETGAGVKVKYTGGSPCDTGAPSSTTIDFVCDLSSGTTTRPLASAMDDDKCHWSVVWNTAYACPVCNDDYFHELRSACSGGEQSVAYASKLACYGGSQLSDAQSVSTCTEQAVVLDTKALYSVYAAICVVGFVVLLLMMGILIIHRKYRDAYNDYLYLKGKMPVDVKTKEDGSKETTFEFTPGASAIHSSSPSPSPSPSVESPEVDSFDPEEKKHEDMDEVNLRIQSV